MQLKKVTIPETFTQWLQCHMTGGIGHRFVSLFVCVGLNGKSCIMILLLVMYFNTYWCSLLIMISN